MHLHLIGATLMPAGEALAVLLPCLPPLLYYA